MNFYKLTFSKNSVLSQKQIINSVNEIMPVLPKGSEPVKTQQGNTTIILIVKNKNEIDKKEIRTKLTNQSFSYLEFQDIDDYTPTSSKK